MASVKLKKIKRAEYLRSTLHLRPEMLLFYLNPNYCDVIFL